VVANAGFIEHAQIFDLSKAHYDKTMGLNVKGVVFTVRKAFPLITRGPAHGIYAATKVGVRALVRTWTEDHPSERAEPAPPRPQSSAANSTPRKHLSP